MTIRATALATLALAFATPALASERQPTLAELERELVCPTCQSVLELSHAPIAERMRSFIRARIAAGDTKSEIKETLVAQLGQGVLAAPPTRGFDLLAWIPPFVGLVGSGLVIAAVAWRWTRLGRETAGVAAAEVQEGVEFDAALQRRLNNELARFNR